MPTTPSPSHSIAAGNRHSRAPNGVGAHWGHTSAANARGTAAVRASARVGPGRGRTRLTPPRYWKRHGRVHLHHAQGPQGPRRQGDPRRRHAARSTRARRSASSGPTAPASRACSRSWPGSTSPPTATRFLTPGYSVGILMQEPRAQRGQGRPGQRRGGPRRDQGQARPVTTRSPRRWRSSYSDELMEEMGQPAGGDRRRRRVGPRLPARAGDGRAALPAAGRRRHGALRRRAPPGRAVQAAAEQARPAAARRAHQPPGRRERAVARAAPGDVRRRRARRHPRPVLPGQRGRSGSSSSTAAAPTPTRATTRPTWRRSRSACRSRARRTLKLAKRLKDELEWVRHERQGPPDQEQGAASRATRRWRPRPSAPASSTSRRSRSRRARAWAASSSRRRTCARASATGC